MVVFPTDLQHLAAPSFLQNDRQDGADALLGAVDCLLPSTLRI